MADLQRRVLALETTARVGINRAITAWGTASVSPTAFATSEFGAVGSTWSSSAGTSGTGYPKVQIRLTNYALIIANGRVSQLADDAGVFFRSNSVEVGVGWNGGGVGADGYPDIRRQILNLNPLEIAFPFSIAVMKSYPPGLWNFQVGAIWSNTYPAAVVQPLLSDVTLTVIPID